MLNAVFGDWSYVTAHCWQSVQWGHSDGQTRLGLLCSMCALCWSWVCTDCTTRLSSPWCVKIRWALEARRNVGSLSSRPAHLLWQEFVLIWLWGVSVLRWDKTRVLMAQAILVCKLSTNTKHLIHPAGMCGLKWSTEPYSRSLKD